MNSIPLNCSNKNPICFMSICLSFFPSLVLSCLLVMWWSIRGKCCHLKAWIYARKGKSFTKNYLTENGSQLKYEKWFSPQLSYSLILSSTKQKGQRKKKSTRARNTEGKVTVLLLNTKQEVVCSNPGKKPKCLFCQKFYFKKSHE